MEFLDLFPTKGAFRPGEVISLQAKIRSEQMTAGEIRINCLQLAQCCERFAFPVATLAGTYPHQLDFMLASSLPACYGVDAELVDCEGRVIGTASTAFDVQGSWIQFPRYGFLTDFQSEREIEPALLWLARFHVNGLQFYDWQYRHDQLFPAGEVYTDPLGRELSLTTVRTLIEECHKHGMAAMAYLAVYAASLPFAEAHEAWRLFDDQGRPINFENFLGLMNPESESPWIEHLLSECERTLSELPFDGLHVDQYGSPKIGYNAAGEEVDLPRAFQSFIKTAKRQFPDANITFNAVGNWPIDALVDSHQDFAYIELWPETPSYKHISNAVRGAREKSGGKPVIIANYIPARNRANILLSNAVIMSQGGSRIELGEDGRLLSDPYFPKHQALPSDFQSILRRYYDFAVRYGDLTGPSAENVDFEGASVPSGIEVVWRQAGQRMVLHLVNFTGLESAEWCKPHPAPPVLRDVPVSLKLDGKVREIWFASPDHANQGTSPLPWHHERGRIRFRVPSLKIWTMIVLDMEEPARVVHG